MPLSTLRQTSPESLKGRHDQLNPDVVDRKGIALKHFLKLFPSDEAAEAWFIKQRWPEGVCCLYCGSLNVQAGCNHKTKPFR